MVESWSRRFADQVITHSKLVVILVILATVAVGAGAAVGEMDSMGVGEFAVSSPETEAADFVASNYDAQDGITAQIVVREYGGNVLTRESLRESLRFQQEAREDQHIAESLRDGGFIGIENLVGTAAYHTQSPNTPAQTHPSLEEQIAALDSLTDEEFEALLSALLAGEGTTDQASMADPLSFLPQAYDPGEMRAESRLTLALQVDDAGESDPFSAQLAIDSQLQDRFDDAFIVGQGIIDDASARATSDSFAIIGPIALLLVLFVLGVAYRDPIDLLLAVFGIAVVLVWLAGIMGWLEMPMNVILIAVPFLLIGLGIDYALHVVMRFREAGAFGPIDTTVSAPASSSKTRKTVDNGNGSDQRTAGPGSRDRIKPAMILGLASVILALAAATFSTGVGFLSNVVSPLPAIRDFAILSAAGIVATFVAFGLLLPALKVEVDSFVQGRLGRNRSVTAFGVETGQINAVLTGLASVSIRAPLVVIGLAVLLATAGMIGATTVDTEFNEADFFPRDAPAWTAHLPSPFAPGEYTIYDDFRYLASNFQLRSDGGQSQILIKGNVTGDSLLTAIATTTADSPESSTILREADGSPAIDGPHTTIRSVAEANTTFAALVEKYDDTGNDLPDRNLEVVFSALYEADNEAARAVISRDDDGSITSIRLLLAVQADASAQEITEDTRWLATMIEASDENISATPTGDIVTTAVVQDALLETLIRAFAITVAVILLFLSVLFFIQYGSVTQGLIILTPVVAALAWLLGGMALLDIPFNSETAVITSLAIGLGVDYSIHAGERFMTERARHDTIDTALRRTITGTGGALLASAATTAGGFGVLALSLSPPLQRFGLVTGSAIILAFLAVVTILPALLVIRERIITWRQQ